MLIAQTKMMVTNALMCIVRLFTRMNTGATLNSAVIRPVKEETGSIINRYSDVNGDAGTEFIISNSYIRKVKGGGEGFGWFAGKK